MVFEYRGYFLVMVIFPSILFLFSIFALGTFITNTVITIKSRDITIYKALNILISVIVLITFLYVSMNPLVHGGLSLIGERKSESVILNGIIEKVIPFNLYDGQKYYLNGHLSGGRIKINGIDYTIMDIGNLTEGDTIVIECLPKSKVILSVNELFHE